MHLVLLSYIVGCIVSNEWGYFLEAYYVVMGFLVCLVIYPKGILILAFFSLGFFRVYLSETSPGNISEYTGNKVFLQGVVAAYPQVKGLENIVVLKPDKIYLRDEREVSIKSGLVQTRFSKFIEINKGDKVEMEVLLEKPENFAQFDYVEYLKSNNIYATGKNPRIRRVDTSTRIYESAVNHLRKRIVEKINYSFPDPHAKLLAGMIIGTREQFSEEFASNLSISGTTHVVAVSGYNISLIINSIMSAAGYVHRKKLVYISYFGLLGFLLLVGVDNIPALRATLMGFVLLFSMLRGRRSSGFLVLLLVAFMLHIQNPYTYRSLSFQLSFAATGGLMLLSTHLSNLFQKLLPKFLNEDVATTLTAILVTFPITFSNFGKITIYALLANVMIAPLVSLISLIGILWLVVSELSSVLGLVLQAFVWSCLEIMVQTINFTSSLPYADFTYSTHLKEIAILMVVLLCILLFEFNYRDHLKKNV